VPINIVRKRHELLYESNKPNYSAVKARLPLRILIGINSGPFTDGQFIREYLIKTAEVICLEKVKEFNNVTFITVAKLTNDITNV
jgi:hypothetical protein